MNIEIIQNITIGGSRINYLISFSLQQKLNAHHEFQLRFNHDLLGSPGLITLDRRQELLGKSRVATLARAGAPAEKFVGIVTEVSITQRHGYNGVVVAKGC